MFVCACVFYLCVCSRYLGEGVQGILHPPQHATGPLGSRKLQLPVQVEQSGELGHARVGASGRKDLGQHCGGAAALGVTQLMDEGILVGGEGTRSRVMINNKQKCADAKDCDV